MKMPEPDGYLMDTLTYEKLRRIMNRLYDDRPLSPDQRRDLANAMYAVMNEVIPYVPTVDRQ